MEVVYLPLFEITRFNLIYKNASVVDFFLVHMLPGDYIDVGLWVKRTLSLFYCALIFQLTYSVLKFEIRMYLIVEVSKPKI